MSDSNLNFWFKIWIAASVAMLPLTALFWLLPLDLNLLMPFYDPSRPLLAWPGEYFWFWQFLYRGAPAAVILIVVLTLGRLAWASYAPSPAHLRQAFGANVLLLTLIVGPGLLINGVFKENWGRPRPRQVVELGGTQAYVPPLQWGSGGKSFPCGHCSVGFSLLALAVVASPAYRLPWVLLALGLGTLIGVSRMAAGAHFASDVLWAAYLSFTAALLVYVFLPRPGRATAWSLPLYVLGAVGGLAGALLATPFHQNIYQEDAQGGRALLRLESEFGDMVVQVRAQPSLTLQVNARGFGWPFNSVQLTPTAAGYQLTRHGWFTELSGQWLILLPPEFAARLELHAAAGRVVTHADTGLSLPPFTTTGVR